MIDIQISKLDKIKNYIDDKYHNLIYYNKFLSGNTLSITDENNNVYGFINDDVETPLFIPNKYIGIANESFIKYLEYKGLNESVIEYNGTKKTIYQIKPKLKIERYGIDDIYNFDFSIILMKSETIIHKGKKVEQNYIDENSDIIVTKYYEDIIGERLIYGNMIPNRIIGLNVRIIWWTENNEIGLEKTIDVKKFSREEEGERIKNYRVRQIATLKGMAMGTEGEPVVNAIYEHYDKEIYNYINQGTGEFLSAITYETDPTINYYLNIEIPNITTYDLEETDFYLSGESYYINDKITYDNCIAKVHETLGGYIIHNGTNIETETSLLDGFYKIKIIDDFIPIDGQYTFVYKNVIKDYITHDIDSTK